MAEKEFHMNNPYRNTFPLNINELPSRNFLLHTAVNRIVHGQSLAIISSPRLAKTSLLKYLSDVNNLEKLYGEYSKGMIFSLIDCQMLPSQLTSGRFWDIAFKPLWGAYPDEQAINEALRQCKEANFDIFSVQDLVSTFTNSGVKFVLILDEFDYLIAHPEVGNWNFFGALRSLLAHRGFTGIVACRQPLDKLEGVIFQSGGGSPFSTYFIQYNCHHSQKKTWNYC